MNQNDFANFFDVDKRTVRNWCQRGMPRIGSGQNARYTPESARWAREYRSRPHGGRESGPLKEAQARKIGIEADRGELKLAADRGEVVRISDVRQAVEQVASNIRARLTQMPAKLTQRLHGCGDKQRFASTIEAEISDALRELETIATL